MGTYVELLLLLLAVNGAPVLVAYLLGRRWNVPVDLGRVFADGRPVFGKAKTWRGLVSGVIASCLVALVFGFGTQFGLAFGALVMSGDLLASFIKRRMGLKPSDQCSGLDQIPESLIPALYAVHALSLPWTWVILLPLGFMVGQVLMSIPLYRLKIRKRPY